MHALSNPEEVMKIENRGTKSCQNNSFAVMEMVISNKMMKTNNKTQILKFQSRFRVYYPEAIQCFILKPAFNCPSSPGSQYWLVHHCGPELKVSTNIWRIVQS